MNRLDRIVLLCVVGYAVALLALGPWLHPVPVTDSAEVDGYLTAAEQIRAGEVPVRVFQPLLYPALCVLLSFLVGDEFVAARALSTIAAGIALWMTYRLARRVGTPRIGGLAAGLMAASPTFVGHAMLATSDAAFLALVLVALDAVARIAQGDERWRARFAAGAWIGLAWSTRYVGVALALPVLFAIRTRRLAGWSSVAAGAIVAALPQFAVNIRNFGSPTYSEHWRNLAMKLDGRVDWSMLHPRALEHEGWWEVVSAEPVAVAAGAWRELCAVVADGLPTMVGNGAVGLVLELLFVIGAVAAARERGPRLTWAVFAIAYAFALCTTFYGTPRLLLPLLPTFLLLATGTAGRLVGRCGRIGTGLAAVAIAGAIFASGFESVRSLQRFRTLHSVGFLRAARWLADHEGAGITVVGDHPKAQPLVRYRYLEETRAVVGYGIGATDAVYLEALRLALEVDGAQFAVFSERWRGPRPECLATGEGVPEFLVPVHREPGAVVYRVRARD